jgi:hypothetical protein
MTPPNSSTNKSRPSLWGLSKWKTL